ncbi:MAG: Gfo/Idh/MocA family oxidoreductase [Armatimonadetes bacterium]|nr:Gfo/Idh/MocA family oxidoreductase [Armatimonadota bacterium]
MKVRFGIIGGGLMGRELASAMARWFMLTNFPSQVELVAVADIAPRVLEWFRQVPSVDLLTTEYRELLARDDVDAVYVAVPHDLHEQVYVDTLAAGKDLLAEKPFGIDLRAALRIQSAIGERFVRCSSEFPFFPAAQGVYEFVSSEEIGDLLEVNSAFLHSSDLDLTKPINWKRQSVHCGEAGVMNDLGLHVLHVPLRMGYRPTNVFAQLQNVVRERPDGAGGRAPCDTWDNATVHANLEGGGIMRLETKRLAPGETNTWSIEVKGTRGGAKFSTKEPKTLWTSRGGSAQWSREDIGHKSVIPVATGGIFEFGFPDALLQMLAAFVAERNGHLEGRFGCATVDEALDAHRVWTAALESQRSHKAVPL